MASVVGAVLGVALTDEGIRRSASFWGVAFPIFLHYRFVQWQTEGLSDAEIAQVLISDTFYVFSLVPFPSLVFLGL